MPQRLVKEHLPEALPALVRWRAWCKRHLIPVPLVHSPFWAHRGLQFLQRHEPPDPGPEDLP
jgi:hypothetical protein